MSNSFGLIEFVAKEEKGNQYTSRRKETKKVCPSPSRATPPSKFLSQHPKDLQSNNRVQVKNPTTALLSGVNGG